MPSRRDFDVFEFKQKMGNLAFWTSSMAVQTFIPCYSAPKSLPSKCMSYPASMSPSCLWFCGMPF